MSAVNNYVAIPFFDRVPPRANDLVLSTFDSIVEKAVSLKEAYHFFANSLKDRGIEGPGFSEFEGWYARVKNGLVERPHPSDAIATDPAQRLTMRQVISTQPTGTGCAVDVNFEDFERLKQARAIVEAAHQLFEAKIAAGHSPLSVSIEDTIVSEALRELLHADGEGMFADAASNALDSALVLLQSGTAESQDKLLDILTMDMQQELCRALVKRPPPQRR